MMQRSGVGLIQRYNPFKKRKNEAMSVDKKRMSHCIFDNNPLNATHEAANKTITTPDRRWESKKLAKSKVVMINTIGNKSKKHRKCVHRGYFN